MRGCRLVTLVAALLLFAAPARSQDRHAGLWIGAGLGGGWSLTGGDGGVAPYVRLGGALSRRVLLGVEVIALGRDEQGALVGAANATVLGMIYPSPSRNLFFRAGIGFGAVRLATVVNGVTVAATEHGIGLTAGVGRDVKLGANLYMTPNVDFMLQSFDTETFRGTDSYLLITVGLTRH